MKKITTVLVFVCTSLIMLAAGTDSPNNSLQNADTAVENTKTPPLFIQNQGQVDPQVKYYIKGSGLTAYFTENSMVFDLMRDKESEKKKPHQFDPILSRLNKEPSEQERLVIRLNLEDSLESPDIRGIKPHQARMNYLKGNDPAQWFTQIPTFREILYRDIYPNIDLRLYTENHIIRYDFIVNPGGDPSQIQLSYEGVDNISILERQLVAATAFGDFMQSEPRLYQSTPDNIIPIDGDFILTGKNAYGFQLDSYNPAVPLVIDPALHFSTYLGGGSADYISDIQYLMPGFAVTGTTESTGFPAYLGYDTSHNGGKDAFVSKFDGNGNLLVSTFLGGTSDDLGKGLYCDASYTWVTGQTQSTDFPTSADAYKSSNQGSADVFATCLNAAGSSLVYSTYIGGTYGDYPNAIAGNSAFIYICGTTSSADFPNYSAGGPPFQTTIKGIADAFVFCFQRTDLSYPYYSTFIGGSNYEEATDIKVAAMDRAIVVGFTGGRYEGGDWFPTTAGAYQTSYGGGTWDGFVTKLSTFGTSADYSTFIGGGSHEYCESVALYNNRACVTGYTNSINFPTLNAYQDSLSGYTSAFVTKLTYDGDGLLYSTYLGGTGQDWGKAIACDFYGHLHVGGETNSSDFPIRDAYQGSRSTGSDGFVAKIDPLETGDSSLLFSTYLGGSGSGIQDEYVKAIDASLSVNYANFTVTAGITNSSDFPTRNAYQNTFQGGGADGFITIFNASGINIDPDSINFNKVGVGNTSDWTTITVTSNGTGVLNCGTVSLNGSNPGQFSTRNDNVSGSHLRPGQSGTIEVRFEPGSTGGKSAFLTIPNSTENNDPVHISLSGTGVEKPTVSTAAVSGIQYNTADSGGNVTDSGGAAVTARGVCWNTTGDPTTADSHTTNGTGTGTFTSSLTGLDAGQTYYVRAYATNTAGTAYGNQRSFNTLDPVAPSVNTAPVSSITDESAQSGGEVTDDGGASVTARGVCWNTTGSPTTADSHTTNGTGTGPFVSNLTSLSAGQTYFVRAYATNSVSTAYGNERSFTTNDIATVTTAEVTGITDESAQSGGEVTDNGGASVTARGVCWNTTGNPTTADSHTTDGSGTGIFTSSLTGLSPDMTYFVRAYATNSVGTAYGNERQFNTPELPTVVTYGASSITDTTAESSGEVTLDGGAAVTARGHCWNTTGNPTTADSHTTDGSGTGAFTSSLTSLTPGETYYVRAYATNSVGTAYSNLYQFTTLSVPTVTTLAVSAIQYSTAEPGGNVTDQGGTTVTERGVCWNTTGTPTISDDHMNEGTGPGHFYVDLTGLTPGTTYYIRAYAVNSIGLAYGNEVEFTTLAYDNSPSSYQVIPEVLWAPASGGGTWQTEVHITDITGGSQVQTYFNASTGDRRGPFDLFTGSGPGVSVKTPNLLQTLALLDPGFDYSGKAGAVEFITQDSNHHIHVIARTKNGDYSKTFQGLNDSIHNTADTSRSMMIQNLRSDETYRTTYGGFVIGGDLTVSLDLIGSDGSVLGSSVNIGFTENQFVALDPFAAASASGDNVWMKITPISGSGRVFSYCSTANRATNDPAMHPAVPVSDLDGYNSPSNVLFIPEALWAPASGGGEWTTAVQITDLTGGSDVQVYYSSSSGDVRGPISLFTGAGANTSLRSPNILKTLDMLDPGFDYSGTAGSLAFMTQDSSHHIHVSARTTNQDGSKTFQGLNESIHNTCSLERVMMVQNMVLDGTYRASFGVFNPSGDSVTVEFSVINNDGNTMGTPFQKTISDGQYMAFDPFAEAGIPPRSETFWVKAEAVSGTGEVILYGATANNQSGDPAVHRGVQQK